MSDRMFRFTLDDQSTGVKLDIDFKLGPAYASSRSPDDKKFEVLVDGDLFATSEWLTEDQAEARVDCLLAWGATEVSADTEAASSRRDGETGRMHKEDADG